MKTDRGRVITEARHAEQNWRRGGDMIALARELLWNRIGRCTRHASGVPNYLDLLPLGTMVAARREENP